MKKLKILFNRSTNRFIISLFIVLVSSLVIARSFLWFQEDGSQSLNVIRGDGLGYYHYLPKIFIDHNLDYEEDNLHFIIEDGSKKYNKCFVGPAIFMAPFFTFGYIYSSFTEYQVDGYSFPFQLSIGFGSILYVFLGLFFLSKLLFKLGFSKSVVSFALLLVFFGTNLISGGILEPAMSHSYSFFSISLFLYLSYCFFLRQNLGLLFILSIVFGLILLLRPTNGIVLLLIPFLLFRSKQTVKGLLSVKNSIVAIFPALLIISIQVFVWFEQTGDFFVLGYSNEGFNFLEPKVWDVLFGFRKGWFIYTPIALFSLLGLIKIYKADKRQFFSLLIFLMVLIYLTSSWWMWYYGPSFSMRPFIDFYALVGILLAFSMTLFQPKGRVVFIMVCTLCVILNLAQSYQYQRGIISSWDMNYEKYKAAFGVFERGVVILGGNRDILPYNPKIQSISSKILDFEGSESTVTVYDSISNSHVADYSNKEYNVSSIFRLGKDAISSKGLFIDITLSRYNLTLNSSRKSQLIIELIDSNDVIYHHYWFHLNETPSEELDWKQYNYKLLLPSAKNANDKLNFYIRNQEKKNFYLDNVELVLNAIN